MVNGDTTTDKSVTVTGMNLDNQNEIAEVVFKEVIIAVGNAYSFNATSVSDTDIASLELASAVFESM